ncbi:MAG TPA: S41 family peptidase [Candidatus Paceibacterota bacterium]|nr:S41 family peptidase [Candidatus Paceibacterota bacterium]
MNINFKNLRTILILILVGLIIFSGGLFSANFINLNQYNIPAKNSANAFNQIDLTTFWKVWKLLDDKYKPVDSDNKISDQEKIFGAIKGMVNSLNDPYTQFLTPEENKKFEDSIQGEFFGVGMEIGVKEKMIVVVSPLKNTPAERSGIIEGDIILSIDGISTFSMSIDDAVSRIRGPIGTSVKLTVFRESADESFDIEIIRDKINIPTLDTEIIDDVFIISLYNFSSNSTSQFRNAFNEFKRSGKDKLILDLRGNPGGFLDASIDIASWFLPTGKVIVKENFGNNVEKIFRSKGYGENNKDFKMVVLVNSGSASASEIVAGALQEHGVATIIGTSTFGKGSVQELVSVTKDTSLKVTVAQWLTPDGNSISNGGLKPDILIEESPDDNISLRDYQMQKAIELLK